MYSMVFYLRWRSGLIIIIIIIHLDSFIFFTNVTEVKMWNYLQLVWNFDKSLRNPPLLPPLGLSCYISVCDRWSDRVPVVIGGVGLVTCGYWASCIDPGPDSSGCGGGWPDDGRRSLITVCGDPGSPAWLPGSVGGHWVEVQQALNRPHWAKVPYENMAWVQALTSNVWTD